MNRRDKKSAKLLEFEPKVPVSAPAVSAELPAQIPRPQTDDVAAMKGCFAPLSFTCAPKFNPADGGYIVNLPDFLLDASLVLFTDGSFGLRKNGVVYECDTSHLGDSMVVELSDTVSKTGDANFLITGYQVEKPSCS